MNSKTWKKIRRMTASASLATLAITPLCQAQDASTDNRNPIEARIRIRPATETKVIQEEPIEFKPVPSLDGSDSNVQRGTLLNSRFHGFPKAGAANSIPSQAKTNAQSVSPVAWEAPATSAGPTLLSDPAPPNPAASTPMLTATIRPQDQDPQSEPVAEQPQGQEIAEFGPGDETFQGLEGNVKIIVDEKTGNLRIIGSDADIKIVTEQIKRIEESTKSEKRLPERIPLRYSESADIVESIKGLYDQEYAGQNGDAEIIPLTSPNALLVFGSQSAIDAIRDLVNKAEADVDPEMARDFKSFSLEHVSAADAKRRLDEFFSGGDNPENALPVGSWTVVADYRSNVVVVRGNAQVLRQAELLVNAIDIDDESVKSTKEVRVFQLQNAVAGDLAIILLDAITGSLKNVAPPLINNTQGGGLQPATAPQDGNEFSSEPTPSRLQLQTIGKDGKVLTSGLLFDVRITPDSASNSLIVRAPATSMPLIEELVKQLDRLPNAETLIKVFQIVNGDAEQLLTMLDAIFGASDDQGQFGQTGGIADLPLQTTSASPGSALVNLRFAIDQRTNSIIATGPAGDLQVVEDLLNRLDEDLRSRRETIVYRLSNSNVLDVEEALNNLLDSRETIIDQDPRLSANSVNADQDIVIVPEVGSNSLIISALPENFPEIEGIIRRLDRRPPMVKVKVMMAEIDLGTVEEFGIELGIQDSLLFDRSTSVANNTTGVNGFGNGITGTGFDFNGSGVANTNATFRETIAGQALSSLGLGRTNAALGYGGLVLSAGNESVNVLLRALKDRGCLRVLSRPHIMTLENLQGRVSIGQVVPRITSSGQNQFGTIQNQVEDREVGVILEITPRVSPDGMITMFVNIVKSALGSEADGVAVAVDNAGNVVRQAPIDAIEAQTTVLSRSGQTIVFSGLIQESKQHAERGAPILSDLPVIGPLFKFETDQASRSELLIIMTPYLVDTEEAIEAQNRDEMERMHWCLCDVAEVYGNTDFDPVHSNTEAMETVYPSEGEIYWSSEAGGNKASQPSSQSNPVRQVGFLQKMKLGLKDSPVARIADRIRGNNRPNVNERNRQDFEDLKRLRSQRQE
jgi:type II secretory pathway component GspD/PulD (secretin)